MAPFVEVDGGKLRELEAEARRRGLTLSQALDQAIDLWLSKVRDEEREMNNAVYQRMKGEIFSKYRDKYVVIAKGDFVGGLRHPRGGSRGVERAQRGPRDSLQPFQGRARGGRVAGRQLVSLKCFKGRGLSIRLKVHNHLGTGSRWTDGLVETSALKEERAEQALSLTSGFKVYKH